MQKISLDELSLVQVNQCGGCTACCVQYCLPELNKPARVPCQHLCETGCSLHDQPRPQVCAEFTCGYLLTRWPLEMRPDNCGIIFQLEAAIHRDPHDHSVTLKTLSLDELRNQPAKLWTGNCITSDAFRNPPQVVNKFIYWVTKKKGAVALTHGTIGSMSTKIFAQPVLDLTEKRYWEFFHMKNADQLNAVREFKKSPRIIRDCELTDEQVLYAYRKALSVYRNPTGDREFDAFIERALTGAHQNLARRGLPRDGDDHTTPNLSVS